MYHYAIYGDRPLIGRSNLSHAYTHCPLELFSASHWHPGHGTNYCILVFRTSHCSYEEHYFIEYYLIDVNPGYFFRPSRSQPAWPCQRGRERENDVYMHIINKT